MQATYLRPRKRLSSVPVRRRFEKILKVEPLEQRWVLAGETYFQTPQLVHEAVSWPLPVATADLDGDGVDEMVVAAADRVVWIDIDPMGRSVSHELPAEAAPTSRLRIGDLNGDHWPDIIAFADSNVPTTVWWENLQNGEFTFHELSALSTASLIDVAVADIDGDQDDDVVMMTYGTAPFVQWYENDQLSFTPHALIEPTQPLLNMVVTDLNSDDRPDIVLGASGQTFWHKNLGGGGFQRLTITPPGVPWSYIAAGDLDGDGDKDLFQYSLSPPALRWLQNNGQGVFTIQSLDLTLSGPVDRVAVGDMNGDHVDDVTVAAAGTSLMILYGPLNSTPLQTQEVTTDWRMGSRLTVADVDGDGRTDILDTWNADDARTPISQVMWFRASTQQVSLSPVIDTKEESATEPIAFQLSREGEVAAALDVTLTVAGNATTGVDFVWTNGVDMTSGLPVVRFAAGETLRTVTLRLLDDEIAESREIIEVGLSRSEFAVATTGETAVVYIVDDEGGDFGDAPETYATSNAGNGAKHIANGPVLGMLRDSEADGQPSAAASEDGGDEDGIVLGRIVAGDNDALATIEVTSAPSGAYIDAWVDWDQDGIWNTPSEQIIAHHRVTNGTNMVTFAIPATARFGTTFARFRLSSTGGLSPGGLAVDGEVEDYAVIIEPPQEATGTFKQHPISVFNYQSTLRHILATDLDQDGDTDFLGIYFSRDWIVWYEQTSPGTFDERTISSSSTLSLDMLVVDFDTDGDLDIVLLKSERNSVVRWLENDGSQTFTEHVIGVGPSSSGGISVSDIDRDGDFDVVLASPQTSDMLLFDNEGNGQFRTHRIADVPFNSGNSGRDARVLPKINILDIDRDGMMDIFLSTVDTTGNVNWYKNLGDRKFERRSLWHTDQVNMKSPVLADMDADGDLDLLFAASLTIQWVENSAGEYSQVHAISREDYLEYMDLEAVDIDGNGRLDVLATFGHEQTPPRRESKLYRQSADGTSFTSTTLHEYFTNFQSSLHHAVGDIDGDGDLDIVGRTMRADVQLSHPITWYENIDNFVSITATAATMSETSPTDTPIVIRRSGSLTDSVDVTIDIGGAATLGIDFQLFDGGAIESATHILHFEAGEGTKTLSLRGVDDTLLEPHKTIVLSVGESTGYSIAAGQVELLLLDDEPSDYGDASEPYFTLASRDGARHGLTGPTLGELRDAEFDGSPSAGADGDDLSGPVDDEDGVFFDTYYPGQLGAMATVRVRNAPAGAYLDAWIDFDGDGSWNIAGEQIAKRVLIQGETDFVVRFDVPRWANSETGVARFRISSIGGLPPQGFAADGEVEDYIVQLKTLFPTTSLSAEVIRVAPEAITAMYEVLDWDRDGDSDVVFAASGSLQIATQVAPRAFSIESLNVPVSTVYSTAQGDLNGDGSPEIIFGDFSLVAFERLQDGSVATRVIATRSQRDIQLGDLDGDGDIDLLTTENSTGIVGWYENPASVDAAFAFHQLSRSFFIPPALTDFDRDGDLDFLLNDGLAEVSLYVNDGKGKFERVPLAITLISQNPYHLRDYDNDGDLDIITVNTILPSSMVLYENLGDHRFRLITLIAPIQHPTIAIADLDGDFDVDILPLPQGTGPIDFYENLGNDMGVIRRMVANTELRDYAREATLVDLDGDRHLDLTFVGVRDSQFFVMYGSTLGDFNHDNVTDLADLDNLVTAVATQSTDVMYDINYDGAVDGADVDHWVTVVRPTLPGDANLDGSVDAADFNRWNAHKFTTTGTWSQGDFNADGVTDAADFNIWQSRKFTASSPASAAAPAPAASPRPVRSAAAAATVIDWVWAEESRRAQRCCGARCQTPLSGPPVGWGATDADLLLWPLRPVYTGFQRRLNLGLLRETSGQT